MMKRNCVYTVDDHEVFTVIDRKLKTLMKFFTVFGFSAAMAAFCSIIAHIGYLGRERKLFFNIGFPLDYKTSEMAFWLALAFNSTEEIVAVLIIFFSTIVWYLMVQCAFRYELLGHKLRTLGTVKADSGSVFQFKVSKVDSNRKQFLRDLMFGIRLHRDIREYSLGIRVLGDDFNFTFFFVTAQPMNWNPFSRPHSRFKLQPADLASAAQFIAWPM